MLNPEDALALQNLEIVLSRSGRSDEAIDVIRNAIEFASPTDDRPYINLAVALTKQGRFTEALEAYHKVMEINPESAAVCNSVAWILATCPAGDLRGPRSAVELAQRAVEREPNDGAYWNTLGVAQYQAGDSELAITSLQRSMELRDGRGDSYDWFFLAMAHHQLGHEDEAHKWYDKAVEWMDAHQSDNQELFRFRAEAEETLGINRQDAARRFPPPPPLPTNRNN